MKKILIVPPNDYLTATGGTSTVFNNLCNFLAKKYLIIIASYNKSSKKLKSLNCDIKIHNLYLEQNKLNYSEAMNLFISNTRPDLIIYFFLSSFYHSRLNDTNLNIPKIIMFHSRPDFYLKNESISKHRLKKTYKNCYNQILFDDFINLLPNYINKNNVFTIPNGIKIPSKCINANITKKRIIYLSRIDSWKGLELLIKTFKIVVNKYPDWILDIYGQSQPQKYVEFLKFKTKKYGLQSNIRFLGITKNSLSTCLKYDFCIFPSYFEGFSIGLLESLSVGLPCIGLKKASGVNKLIKNGRNGFLCDDNPRDIANKIELLIKNNTLRCKMSKNSVDSSKIYDISIINHMWIKSIDSILNNEFENSKIKSIRYKNNIFPITKISKMEFGCAKSAYVNYKLLHSPSKFIWLFLFIFFKIFIPDGSWLQHKFNKFRRHL